MTARRGIPTTAELVAAVRGFLTEDVMPDGGGDARVRYLARVAANVLAQCERELELGPAQAAEHARRLADLGVADDAALVRAIRDGSLDDRLAEVVAVTRADVVARLRIANPRHLLPADRQSG